MPRFLDELLDIDFAIAEGALGFARRRREGRRRIPPAESTRRMPLPPPPAAALSMTGNPIRRQQFCSLVVIAYAGRWYRARTGTPEATAAHARWSWSRADRMLSPDGPIKISPAAAQASAKSAFSLRKP